MPIKPPDMPPKTKALVEEVDTETSDRVKRISGLADKMNRMNKEAEVATKKITSQISSVAVKQKETDNILKEIRETPSKEIESMVPAVKRILENLGLTVQHLATGMKNITVTTARATKDAVSQYGKAISEDISVNKQSFVAMTLAKTTPIFGYFAAKFMETDVFKNAARKIRERISSTISSVATAAGSKIRSLFSRKPKGIGEVAEKVTEEEEGVPELQRGGYIERGGLARLHPAEAVVPIDDLLNRIDERVKPAEETKGLIEKGIGSISTTSARLEKYVGAEGERRKGLVRDFLSGFVKATNLQQGTWQDRMLRATLDLKVGLLGMSSRLRLAWQRTLVLHPVFRTLIMLTTQLTKAFAFPFRFLFAARGKYISMLRKATKSASAYERMTGILGLIFTEGMFKLDQLNSYMKQLLEFQAGEAKELKSPTWRVARKMLKGAAIPFEFAVKKLGEKQMLFSKEQAEMLTRERKGILGLFRKKKEVVAPGRAAIDIIADASVKTTEQLEFFKSFFPRIEKKSLEVSKEQALEMKKTRKGVYEVSSGIGGMRSRLRKLGGSVWKYIMMGLMMIKNFISPFTSKISSLAGMFLKGGLRVLMSLGKGLASAIGPFLGPIMAVALAGAFGAAVGTLINKYLINPLVNKWYEALDKKTKEYTDSAMRSVEEARRKATEGKTPEEQKRGKEEIGLKTGMTKVFKKGERQEAYGKWGATSLALIQGAQEKFMDENLEDYLVFGADQVNQLRAEWIAKGGFRKKKLFESPEVYGIGRERSFYNYMREHGKEKSLKLGAEEKLTFEETVQKHGKERGLRQSDIDFVSKYYAGRAEEKRKGITVPKAEYLRRETEIDMAGEKMLTERIGKKITEGAKETGEMVGKIASSTINLALSNSANSNVTVPQMGNESFGESIDMSQVMRCETQ